MKKTQQLQIEAEVATIIDREKVKDKRCEISLCSLLFL